MKKFFGLMIAAMFSLSSFASAASVLEGLKLSGEITVNKVSVDNETSADATIDDYRSESSVRTIINMDMPIADDMDARVVLTKNDQQFGDNGNADQSLQGVQNNVMVTNAYIKVKGLFDLIDLKVGRMFYGERNSLSIYVGPNYDYALEVSAIDGYLATAEIAGLNVEYLDAKIEENQWPFNANEDNDIDLQGLCLSPVSKIADMVSAKFYAYKLVDNLPTGAPAIHDQDTLLLYGVKASADISGVNVKAEYAMNGGENEQTDVKYKGKAMIVGASAKVATIGLRAEMASGSGDKASADKNEDFTATATDVRYGEVWGNTAVNGAGVDNLNVVNVGADYDVNDKVKASADYLMLKRNEKVGGTDKIGNEIDLKATYEHSENLSIELVVARLMVDSVVAPSDIDKVNLQMNFKF